MPHSRCAGMADVGGNRVEVNRQVALLRKGVAKAGGSAEATVDWETNLRTMVAKGRLRAELAEAFAFLQPKL